MVAEAGGGAGWRAADSRALLPRGGGVWAAVGRSDNRDNGGAIVSPTRLRKEKAHNDYAYEVELVKKSGPGRQSWPKVGFLFQTLAWSVAYK